MVAFMHLRIVTSEPLSVEDKGTRRLHLRYIKLHTSC